MKNSLKLLFISSVVLINSANARVPSNSKLVSAGKTQNSDKLCFVDYRFDTQLLNNVYNKLSIAEVKILDQSNNDGQKLLGITIDNSSSTEPCINFSVIKKKSAKTKVWVQNLMGDSWNEKNMMTTWSTWDKMPEELNFAFKLNLKFISNEKTLYKCKAIYLGQGVNGAKVDNWWLFSNNNDQNYTLTCRNQSTYQTYPVNMVGVQEFNEFNLQFSMIN